MPSSLSIKIGGEAGQGVQSVSAMLARIFQRLGLYVFACQDKESRIRGGHNFVHIAAGPRPVYAPSKHLDMLICLDRPSIELHSEEVGEKGLVLFDGGMAADAPGGAKFFGLRLGDIAKETAGNAIMSNSVAVGAALAWTGVQFEPLAAQLKSVFAEKGDDIVNKNIAAAKAGYDRASGQLENRFDLQLPGEKPDSILIQGAHAIALGAIAAGCSFISAYPMSPATAILEYFFARRDELGLVAMQAEDEIAAINMAIGASYAGVRAMTSTSGGGFSLMVEGLGLAGITETPVVIVNAQRPGPSTGLPTRTEQGDLEFVTYASQGEFPRVVLTPGTAGQAFRAMVRAFSLAEKYHIPVIVLVDQYMCDSIWTEQPFDLSAVEIDRGPLYAGAEGSDARDYRRYESDAENGVSPRAFPGDPRALVRADSDEHDERGLITEDAAVRRRQADKRMRKLGALRGESLPPALYGPEDYEELVVCWGTTLGAALPAVEKYRETGASCSLLHVEQAWPPAKDALAQAMTRAKKNICVEMNAMGQLAHLIRAETGMSFDRKVLKYDGRPFLPEELAEELGRES
jgi:2-oxoglutarate ferredoxin oxidoreductase subunit alpha